MSLSKFTWIGLLWVSGLAHAGTACSDKALSPDTVRQAMQAAQQVQTKLDLLDSDIVAIARVGQDLSDYHLRYSHIALVQRQAEGRWRVIHLLNECGTNQSDLWYQGLGNFFLDDMHAYDALLLIPPSAIASKLKQRLENPGLLRSLHNPHYSMVAYPFSTLYQNSNDWVLEQLAAASSNSGIYNRDQAQSWLKRENYQPTELTIRSWTRLGGRMFKANIAFDDHPNALRFSSRIQTVTVDSIAKFFMNRNAGWRVEEVKSTVSTHY